ncbi:MAG: FAD-dependent oxidoreductase, partial [Clostridia bacterium]|nr:FAD-dependent oxidoreductase [Clostridia bacterium]
FGLAEELLRLSVSMGHENDPVYASNWLESDDPSCRTENDRRFEVQYNPHLFAMLAEQLLLSEGVQILYGSAAAAVSCSERHIDSVIIENKSGRSAVLCKTVVDASGDCDIAKFAGAPTALHPRGNILAAWYYRLGEPGYELRLLGLAENEKGECKEGYLVPRRFSGVDAEENSVFMQLSHSAILDDVRKKRETDPGLIPVTIPSVPQLRMTRRLAGAAEISLADEHRYQPHSVGMVPNWRKRGPVYEVPFESLYCTEIRNLITAGRCVSCTNDMWDILRVIPCCAVTGQAAGTAAAMFEDFPHADIDALQQTLVRSGVVLHEDDLNH